MKYDPISRRFFLQGAGGFLLAIPTLTSLIPRTARAQTSEFAGPKYLQFTMDHGRDLTTWYPTLKPGRQIEANAFSMPLVDLGATISPVLGNEWNNLRGKINLIRGLDGLGNGEHQDNYPVTGSSFINPYNSWQHPDRPNSPYSIDAILEDALRFYSVKPLIPALRVRPQLESDADPMQTKGSKPGGVNAWRYGKDLPDYFSTYRLPGIYTRQALYNTLLQSCTNSGSVSKLAPARRLAADLVADDYQQLKKSGRLSSSDQSLLDQFIAKFQEVQTSLLGTSSSGVSCNRTFQPHNGNFLLLSQSFVDLVMLAFQAGVTRIATFHVDAWSETSDDYGTMHDIAHQYIHGGVRYDQMLNATRMHSKIVAYAMSQMDQIAESNGKSMLDNSLVYWSNNLAHGQHSVIDMLALVGGGAAGRMNTGLYVDYRARDASGNFKPGVPMSDQAPIGVGQLGRPINQLLATICYGLGLQASDFEKFKNFNGRTESVGFGDYETSWGGIASEGHIQYPNYLHHKPYVTSRELRRAALPGLLKS